MSSVRFSACDAPRASIVIVAWKQLDLLLSCLQSLSETINGAIDYEVIVVSNAASQAIKDALRSQTTGVRLIESQVNLGFGGACNLGVSAARGEYVVLLNDDAVVAPQWLACLIQTADANPRAGAVGSLILFPDGRIQEAGSVIWADGSTQPVARGEPGEGKQWLFVRKVDYVSACSLLVRRRAWNEVGGFDPEYHPAYYEDVDLCLALRARGHDVLFEPRSRIWHHESASSDQRFKSYLFARNQARLRAKWADELTLHEPARPESPAALARAIWRAEGAPPTILAVDDRVPNPSLGSGYGRMFDALIELARGGYAVSLFSMLGASEQPPEALIAAGVRIVEGDLRGHLSRPWVRYDAVIVSRPHNFSRAAATIRACQPRAVVVYDCEALFWRRMLRQAPLVVDAEERRKLLEAAGTMQQEEQRIVTTADFAVTVSPEEASILQAVEGCCPIRPIRPAEPAVTPGAGGFQERVGVAYVAGWMAGTTSPNADGLRWFAAEVLPRLRLAIPWVRISVTGANPPEDLLRFEDENLHFTGHVTDLGDFYGRARVVIAPIRFGAGVKVKTIQALQYGVPVVSTECGAEGIDTGGLNAIIVVDDPAAFAAALVRLLTDPVEWARQRAEVIGLVNRWHNGAASGSWTSVIGEVLERRERGGHAVLGAG